MRKYYQFLGMMKISNLLKRETQSTIRIFFHPFSNLNDETETCLAIAVWLKKAIILKVFNNFLAKGVLNISKINNAFFKIIIVFI